ncbi:hypothetical protein [Qipengyuania sp.]|uniref:hypothetical protein n=1 Tax=Qipengyuania sp. TaxID=2004515 RepID=UPI0035C7CF82
MTSRVFSFVALAGGCIGLLGCAQGGGGGSGCAGTVITVPAGSNGQGATVPQLMAHASAMGLNQQDAETLIYLEGISPQATLEPGRIICLDGKPD